jgi:UrcA family protein
MTFFTAPRLFAFISLAAIVLPVAAEAAESADQPVVRISTSGVDITSPAGQALLTHRIVVAAHELCDQLAPGDALSSDGYGACVGRATADGKSQLESRIAAASTRAMVASIGTK